MKIEKNMTTSTIENSSVVSYWVKRQSSEQNNGADLVRIKLSSGVITEEGHFPQNHWWNSERFKDADVLQKNSF